YPGSVAGIGWTVNMSSTIGQAFQVGQAVIMAARYAGEMNGSNLSNVNVKYPHGIAGEGCFYDSLTKTINIKGKVNGLQSGRPNTYASWDVIMHEYGHHVQNELGLFDYSGGQHSFEDNLSDIYGKYNGIRFAWAEAYATVFAIMAQYYYSSQLQGISTVCNHDYNSYNNAYLNLETCVIDDDGNRAVSEACEASVAGVLWDMFDTYSSTESFDTLSMSHSDFWDLVTSSGATTLSDFIQYYYLSIDFNGKLAIGNLLSYYEISISDFLLTYVNSIPYFSWTKNGTSDTLQNNVFILSIHNSTGIQLLQKNSL
ncbi:MAG: hypothetical protein K5925_01815, partial [Bacilli bacterium]|nr:hypothetical protein [Bacilli bacterium]